VEKQFPGITRVSHLTAILVTIITFIQKIIGFLIKTLVIALGLGLLTGAIEWLVGWRSPTQISNGLFVVGAALIALGLASALGTQSMRDDTDILWAESIGDFHVWERSQRWLAGMMECYPRFSLLLMTGVYLVGFAVLIPNNF
jgi:hypothetical protein